MFDSSDLPGTRATTDALIPDVFKPDVIPAEGGVDVKKEGAGDDGDDDDRSLAALEVEVAIVEVEVEVDAVEVKLVAEGRPQVIRPKVPPELAPKPEPKLEPKLEPKPAPAVVSLPSELDCDVLVAGSGAPGRVRRAAPPQVESGGLNDGADGLSAFGLVTTVEPPMLATAAELSLVVDVAAPSLADDVIGGWPKEPDADTLVVPAKDDELTPVLPAVFAAVANEVALELEAVIWPLEPTLAEPSSMPTVAL